ncbi:hypothetical protein QAD02_021393 [Eretmocerus hayati]|uniref:Uncharacterized protein n=1 Tax=Eretmocerus hayati TaxID=131215 RepID=A0ACC2PPT8_9HYME|nr:hypothetical protein QAD02_021393 [Eretmocerus hayati]
MQVYVRPDITKRTWGPRRSGGGCFIIDHTGLFTFPVHCGKCSLLGFRSYTVPRCRTGIYERRRLVYVLYTGSTIVSYVTCPGNLQYTLLIITEDEAQVPCPTQISRFDYGANMVIDYLLCKNYPNQVKVNKCIECPCHGVVKTYTVVMSRIDESGDDRFSIRFEPL